MSIEASINVKLVHDTLQKVPALDVIINLLEFGWTFDDNGHCSYLPLGDIDDFEWKSEVLGKEHLLNVVKEKERMNEIIGVVMTWENTGVGGEFLLWNDGSISLKLNVNRKTTGENLRFTDINWYLDKLLPALNQRNIKIEAFSFEEHV
ncbi:hypothetical protein [Brevibacillus borstelensis]|uniref:hypothetical protein n=1 Tax=Brevibacillus borstelensis TaxID=45462 RepID=UPI0004693CE4|nr:hypothetical protein [Brevibacillus borstelensis]WNF04738.1 hypothetical protein RFB14_20425 [Brevibacillus borstelensis]